jgi:hypothetical protein
MQAKGWNSAARLVIAGVLGFLFPLQASSAEGVGWISGVEKTTTGVTVYLAQPRVVAVTRPGVVGRPYVIDSSGRPAPAGVLSLALGDRFSFSNSMHSGCIGEVVVQNGKIGVTAFCGVSAPGLPPTQSPIKFVAAE